MKKNISSFEKIIGVKFKNQNLLLQSLTHKSNNPLNNNEKLEFLGDRVLGLVISKNLYKLFPKDKEGDLDKKLASLVNKKRCVEISNYLSLKDYVLVGDNKDNSKIENKILADTVESIVGALYLDQGLDVTEKFILNYWKRFLNKKLTIYRDPKTMLQEYSLKLHKTLPIYKVLENKGPRHKPVIKVSVKIKDSKKYLGIGNSKKEAEQKAALKLLDTFKK